MESEQQKRIMVANALVPFLDYRELIQLCRVNPKMYALIKQNYLRQWVDASFQWARQQNNEPVEYRIDGFVDSVTVRLLNWELVGGMYGIPFSATVTITIHVTVDSSNSCGTQKTQKSVLAEWVPLSDAFKMFYIPRLVFELKKNESGSSVQLSLSNRHDVFENQKTLPVLLSKQVRHPHTEFELKFSL